MDYGLGTPHVVIVTHFQGQCYQVGRLDYKKNSDRNWWEVRLAAEYELTGYDPLTLVAIKQKYSIIVSKSIEYNIGEK